MYISSQLIVTEGAPHPLGEEFVSDQGCCAHVAFAPLGGADSPLSSSMAGRAARSRHSVAHRSGYPLPSMGGRVARSRHLAARRSRLPCQAGREWVCRWVQLRPASMAQGAPDPSRRG